MVGFRRIVAGTPIANWWDNGAQAIAFSRGTKGFVAINNGTAPLDTTIVTGMASGSYVDRIAGGTIVIAAGGNIHLTLAARTAIVIDTTTRVP